MSERELFFSNFDNEIIEKSNPVEQETYIDTLLQYLNFLVGRIDNYKEAVKYDFIKRCINSMISEINAKYKQENLFEIPDKPSVDKSRLIKLQWTGNINLLVTLFYDLLHSEKRNGVSVLSASKKEVTDFLMNNFLAPGC